MRRDFSGWELYRRTKETIAKAFPHPEIPGRVVYSVWGATQAAGPTVCETQQFIDNIVRVADEKDAKLPPPETLV